MTIDLAALNAALLPTAALIALGWALRWRLGYGEGFWPDLERLTYVVLLPALFVGSLARADFAGMRIGRLALVLLLSSLGGAVVTWLLRRWIAPDDGPAFTSVFQGGVRFNNYIGLVVATALLGPEGLALAALSIAVLVPTVNVTSTLTLSRYGRGASGGAASVVREVASNPLVVACALGMGLYVLARTPIGHTVGTAPGLGGLLVGLGELIRILGQAALPVGLLCVGAGLRRPAGAASTVRLVGWSMALRFVVVPLLTVGLLLALGVTGSAALVAVLFQSSPTASSAYVLARRLGGDAPLMAAIIAAQTVAGMVTIPLWLLAGQAL